MAEGVTHNLSTLFSSADRNFLIRNNGDQVEISSLNGKTVGIYFSASWCGPCRRFTPKLVELYQEIAPKGEFEVVFVSSDRDDVSFDEYFSKMPWLAIPFSDSDKRRHLKDLFNVRGIPNFVVIGSDGKVTTEDGTSVVMEHGLDGYPFTRERLDFLKEQEEEAKRNQTVSSVLVSSSRNYVISNDLSQVPVSELEGKIVGLYFAANAYDPCVEFTATLAEIYKILKDKGEKFEIVLVSLDREEEEFKRGLESAPWLALPFQDKACEKLARYFELQTIPTLVILGPDGKTVSPNVCELIEEHGINAYPFTPEKLEELAAIEKAKQESQTLESLLVSGDKDFVIGKDGSKVPVSELVGKNILLYFSAHWCPPCRAFTPVLVKTYQAIKAKDEAFEVIFISGDTDQAAFDEYYSEMPWLALPFGDERKKFLNRKFKVEGIPTAIAIGPSGRTVTKEARDIISTHGADAYPFTEDRLKQLGEKEEETVNEEAEEDAKPGEGYVCDGDVCRKV